MTPQASFTTLAAVRFPSGNPGFDSTLTPQDKAMLQRHGGGWNEAFCDGHVENGGLSAFFNNRKDDVLRLWNRDNQAHRERWSRQAVSGLWPEAFNTETKLRETPFDSDLRNGDDPSHHRARSRSPSGSWGNSSTGALRLPGLRPVG